MTEFTVGPLRTNTVAYVHRLRDTIQLDPIYQRQGEVWSREKQRLLIDSVINQFDVPKIYFHEHRDLRELEDGRRVRYSLIDGRQRLEAIWEYLDGKFALSDEFVYLADGSQVGAGKTISELEEVAPELAALLSATPLDIMCIRTEDIDLIEEMFSRLNEAVPLNAAEKRNGRGGPLRGVVRGLCEHQFFKQKLPFENRRYRQYDLATKYLLLVNAGGPADTKKRALDEFWDEFKKSGESSRASDLQRGVEEVLTSMLGTFEDADALLSSAGMLSLYFLLFDAVLLENGDIPSRSQLVAFDSVRRLKRFDDEDDLTAPQRRLLEFDRLSQSPNDESALRFRLSVLQDYLSAPDSFQ